MMGNYYLLHPSHRWAAVCISKNACTTLKSRVLQDHGFTPGDFAQIHAQIGYNERSKYLWPVSLGKPPGYTCFAIWRDPVERFLSMYQRFALDGLLHPRLKELYGQPLDAWIDFADQAVGLAPLAQDEHFRPQALYYQPANVEEIIPLAKLDSWYAGRGWGHLERLNASEAKLKATPLQTVRLERIYRMDYGPGFPAG